MTTAVLSGDTQGRSILEICQDVATKIGVEVPLEVFGSSDRTHLELKEVAIEAAEKILWAHDWQKLKRLQAHDGDGVTTEFAMPEDYHRMPKDAKVWSTRWDHPLPAITPEEWLNLDIRDFDIVVGSWTLFGGNFVYKPALTQQETAKFWYISRYYAANEAGAPKERFTLDTDVFRLDDRVLELTMVWVWREQKGLDYSEDMRNAEIALGRVISEDKGARVLVQRSRGNTTGTVAYPFSVTP